MEEKSKYSETDLETALINKLQKFLLELGKGYLFEARQKRFTYGEDSFYVDLVFYNRLLRCYALFDLKVPRWCIRRPSLAMVRILVTARI